MEGPTESMLLLLGGSQSTQEKTENGLCSGSSISVFTSLHTLFQVSLEKIGQNFKSVLKFYMLSLFCNSAGPAQSGILSDREVVNLFLHFTVNPKPRVEYIDRPRCCLRGKECCINRFQQVESRWGYSGTSDRIRYLPECGLGTWGRQQLVLSLS